MKIKCRRTEHRTVHSVTEIPGNMMEYLAGLIKAAPQIARTMGEDLAEE